MKYTPEPPVPSEAPPTLDESNGRSTRPSAPPFTGKPDTICGRCGTTFRRHTPEVPHINGGCIGFVAVRLRLSSRPPAPGAVRR